MRSRFVAKEDKHKAFILRFHPPDLNKTKSLTIEIQALLQILHIDAVVIKSKFHMHFSNPVCPAIAYPFL
jgi:hypothetical protein